MFYYTYATDGIHVKGKLARQSRKYFIQWIAKVVREKS